jgi:ATP-binding cassette subfamily A (ABC1) protein 3
MNHGDIKCCGSPIFLKNLFGTGYQLTASKAKDFKEMEFLNLIRRNIKNYKIETNILAEIKVSLPGDSVKNLSNILSELELEKQNLNIAGYGISSPSIEEVFLKYLNVYSVDYSVLMKNIII